MFKVYCKNCGKEFLGRRNQVFCSRACKDDFRYQQKSKFTGETRGRSSKKATKISTKQQKLKAAQRTSTKS